MEVRKLKKESCKLSNDRLVESARLLQAIKCFGELEKKPKLKKNSRKSTIDNER